MAESTPRPWSRRLSHPTPLSPSEESHPGTSYFTIPPLRSNIASLQAALLGYLGEVETSIRERLQGEEESNKSDTSSEYEAHTTALAGPSNGLRSRHSSVPPDNLLTQLSTIREDVIAYLPVPNPLNREWLRGLPTKLSTVDLGTGGAARQRVLELVHALTPSEDWAGWEKLGWEEVKEDAGDDEPEFLFPNRTPASAMAIEKRRRTVRSKSLGSGVPTYGTFPRLVRSATEPQLPPVLVDEPVDKEEVVTVAEALERSQQGKKLVGYDDLPIWWRNNEHILTGYRFIPLHASTGPIPLIKSAFTMHNETVNIHTHFIPTLLLLGIAIPITLWKSPLPDAHVLDTASLVSYLCAAVACLISSAGWHVLSGCAARKWFEWGACVDYIGISWLIAASFGTVVYNGFYCHPKTVLFYSLTNLTCGAAGSILPFQKWFNERQNKGWRITFFLTLCAAMVAPMIQMFWSHGWEKGLEFTSPFGISILTYIVGLLFYGFHFPESKWPGRFDTWGASHQIWHSFIILAIILHYRAIFVAHAVRYQYSCMALDSGRPVSEVVEDLWRAIFGQ